jgi:hypothetical protein
LFTVLRVRATRVAVAACLAAVALIVVGVVAFAWAGAKLTATADCNNITVKAHESDAQDFHSHPTGTLVFNGPSKFSRHVDYSWDVHGNATDQVIATVPVTSAWINGDYIVQLAADESLQAKFSVSRAGCSSTPPSSPPSGGSGGGTPTVTPTDSPSGQVLGATAPGLPRTGEAPGS